MKIKTTITALGMAVAFALASGCDREMADTEVVADAPLVEPLATEPMETIGEAPMGGDWGVWDTSSDGMLDENEFGVGFDSRWSAWDTDSDSRLSEAEFGTASSAWGDAPGGVDTNGLFDVWDSDEDGFLDNNEFRSGTWSTWDADDNNMIDNNEYVAGSGWYVW